VLLQKIRSIVVSIKRIYLNIKTLIKGFTNGIKMKTKKREILKEIRLKQRQNLNKGNKILRSYAEVSLVINIRYKSVMRSSHRVQGVLSLADDVDEDAGWSFDAFFVERSDEGQIFRIRRKCDGTVVFLQTQFDVTLQTGITPYPENSHGVADRQVLADEEMRRGGSVL